MERVRAPRGAASQRSGVIDDRLVLWESQATLGNDIDGDPEKCGEFLLETDEIEQGCTAFESDEQIDIARRTVVVATHRAENAHVVPAVSLGDLADILAARRKEVGWAKSGRRQQTIERLSRRLTRAAFIRCDSRLRGA